MLLTEINVKRICKRGNNMSVAGTCDTTYRPQALKTKCTTNHGFMRTCLFMKNLGRGNNKSAAGAFCTQPNKQIMFL